MCDRKLESLSKHLHKILVCLHSILTVYMTCASSVASGGAAGERVPPDSKKFTKNQEKEGKNWEKLEKLGRKRQKSGRFFHFTAPDREGWLCHWLVPTNLNTNFKYCKENNKCQKCLYHNWLNTWPNLNKISNICTYSRIGICHSKSIIFKTHLKLTDDDKKLTHDLENGKNRFPKRMCKDQLAQKSKPQSSIHVHMFTGISHYISANLREFLLMHTS